MNLTYFSRSWGLISTWKFPIFAYKLDSLTNISHIGSKLIPWMYPRSVLVNFEDGWLWPIFWGLGVRFSTWKFVLVNTVTQQILVALGPNLCHGCILGVSWLSSKMDDIDLFFEVMGVDFNMKIAIFAYKLDNLTNISRIGSKLIPWMYSRSVLVKFKDG